jgi:DNA-binding NarL/FixJ family response regulator
MINILIVDDHPIVVEGLRKLFSEPAQKFNSAIAYSVAECVKALKVFTPDIVLLDINLPDGSGIDLCKKILTCHSKTKILALSSFGDRSFVSKMLENGASGYLLKDSTEEEILHAVEEVLNGKTYLGFDISNPPDTAKNVSELPPLTRRETEVLKLITDGLTNPEIADRLFISVQTVDSHRKNLLKKFKAKNRAELTKIAFNNGLLS